MVRSSADPRKWCSIASMAAAKAVATKQYLSPCEGDSTSLYHTLCALLSEFVAAPVRGVLGLWSVRLFRGPEPRVSGTQVAFVVPDNPTTFGLAAR